MSNAQQATGCRQGVRIALAALTVAGVAAAGYVAHDIKSTGRVVSDLLAKSATEAGFTLTLGAVDAPLLGAAVTFTNVAVKGGADTPFDFSAARAVMRGIAVSQPTLADGYALNSMGDSLELAGVTLRDAADGQILAKADAVSLTKPLMVSPAESDGAIPFPHLKAPVGLAADTVRVSGLRMIGADNAEGAPYSGTLRGLHLERVAAGPSGAPATLAEIAIALGGAPLVERVTEVLAARETRLRAEAAATATQAEAEATERAQRAGEEEEEAAAAAAAAAAISAGQDAATLDAGPTDGAPPADSAPR